MPRPKVEIINNKNLSSIIYLISRGKNFPSSIAKLQEKDAPNITKWFNILEKKNLIEKDNHQSQKYNIQTYHVNYKTILNEFIKILKRQQKTILLEYQKAKNEKYLTEHGSHIEKINIQPIKILDNNNFVEQFINSKRLYTFFDYLFQNISLDKTIKDIFFALTLDHAGLMAVICKGESWRIAFSDLLIHITRDPIIASAVFDAVSRLEKK